MLRCSQSQLDVKYKSTGFEHFETKLHLPPKKQVEYYKIHKSLFDYKKEREREVRIENEMMERIMPIYSKEDIIQIKNGNM